MARKNKHREIRPSFFKVLMGDFIKHLRIPTPFVENFNGSSIGQCIVKSPTGRHWIVTVEENGNHLYFGSGWQEFVKAHSLEAEEFLVFKYCGNSKFKVKIYDKTCCEKVLSPVEMSNDHPTFHSNSNSGNQNEASIQPREYKHEIFETVNGNNPINLDKSESGRSQKKPDIEGVSDLTRASILSFKPENSCFILTWSESNMYHGIIPIQLVREKKLMAVSSVVLKDPAGRSWPVELRKAADGRMKMKRGWVDFRKANDIAMGDTLIFEFTTIPTILQVHIFRKEGRAISIKTMVFRTDILKRFEAY